MKKEILNLLFVFSFLTGKTQVDMPIGSMSFTVPIYSYVDNLSKLSFRSEFLYNSGRGLEVDEVSNALGTKWNLSGIPAITRIIRGLPDDQIEKPGDVYDLTKYPAGYLYNANPVSLGCPTAESKYPIFTGQGIWVTNSNITEADRELDQFQFVLNGSSGSFVIDKNFIAVQSSDTRAKIEIFTEDQRATKNIRTSIKEFHITDVNGIKYIFSEQETNRAFKISEHNPNGSWIPWAIFSESYDIPLVDNPFITSTWYVSKIIDTKANRVILFTYDTETTKYEFKTQLQTELFDQPPPGPFYNYGTGLNAINGTTADNQSYTVYAYNIKGTILKREIQKKKISKITFPDNSYITFNYLTDRKDLAATKMLDNISLIDPYQNLLIKYYLEHSYFIKNEIRDPVTAEENKWSRLCLKEIKKTGSNLNFAENPWKFEYYTGTNAIEDIVPPYFFHAKDQWGYYNGNYSGVTTTNILDDFDKISWAKVCIYNQPHGYPGGVELFYNSKSGYAKNGLLKTVINPFGGKTEYQYEQNYCKNSFTNYFLSYDHNSSGEAVGGVHISKIIEKPDNLPANDLTTEYIYIDDQGYSTLWGEEALKYQKVLRTFWRAEDKYFDGADCRYRYLYPGKLVTFNTALEDFKLFIKFARKGLAAIKILNYFLSNEISSKEKQNRAVNLALQYTINVLITCLTDAPANLHSSVITTKSNINTNLLPSLYKRVTKRQYSGGGLLSGKTVFEFTSPDDFPLILPNESAGFDQKPRGYEWMYGLLKSEKYYNNSSALLKSTENEYDLKKVDVQDINTSSCNCETYWQQSLRSDQWNTTSTFNEFTNITTNNSYGVKQKVDFYNIVTGHYELKKTTEKIYNQIGDYIVSNTDYLYNPINNLLASQISTTSKGTTIEIKNYYIEDYNLSNPSNTILNQMKNDNILTVPITTETWQTKLGGTPEMLSTSVTEFGLAPNGDYRPIKTYSLVTDKPVPQSTIGIFNPNQLIRDGNLIKQQSELIYDAYGNNVTAKDVLGDRASSTLFGYGNVLPVVSVNNAMANEVAYTSFELNDLAGNSFYWNWSNNSGNTPNNGAQTGKKYADGRSQTDIISYKNKEYKLCFWAKGNNYILTPQILLTQKIAGPTINGWTYYEYDVAATNTYYTLAVDGNGSGIDELRLYPKNAGMVTTTYDLNIGKTSECDINNHITYYEYDGLGRIIKVLDERRNIIKTYEYHFKN